MAPNFDVLKEIIASLLNLTFDLDVLPFYQHCDDLRQEAEIFISLHPDQAQQYLTQGKIDLYNIRLIIADNIDLVNKKRVKTMELMDSVLIKLYDNFSGMLLEIEKL
jgi:hypothetical protein